MLQRLAVALVAALVYVNALHNPFIYDDYSTVVTNTSLVPPVSLRAVVLHDVKRPIVNLSYALDRAVWGARPFGFHVTNIALHVLNVLLLYSLAYALAGTVGERSAETRRLAAVAAAALLAVHPLMTEAVTYISGRSELLCTAFVLASLLCGFRWIRGGARTWAALAIASWIGGLLSKETAAVVPLLLAAGDAIVTPDRAATNRRLRSFHLPLVGVALIVGLTRLVVLARFEQAAPLGLRMPLILIALDVAVRYLALLLVPMHQTLFHAVNAVHSLADPRAVVAVAVLAVTIVVIWTLWRRDGAAAFGLLAFLLLLAPGSLLTALNVGEPMAEHRVYAASCGLFLAAGSGVAWIAQWAAVYSSRPRLLAGSVLAAALIAFAGETLVRNAIWSDPVAVWQESVALAPGHPRPRMLLGEVLEDGGRRTEALEQYQMAVRLQPSDPTAQLKLGLCLAALGRFDEARRALDETIRLDPDNVPARRALQLLGQMKPVA